MTITGIVSDNGKLQVSQNQLAALVEWFNGRTGRTVEITVKENNKRTDKQSKYYWGVIVPEIVKVANEAGNRYNKERVHELLKLRFDIESTTDLNTSEFEAKMEEIRIWAAQFFGITIPLPNELTTPSLILATRVEEGVTIVEKA